MNFGTDVIKAGWLFRQSSVLHRWKRNWFVLYTDGLLRYFDSQDSHHAEEVFILRSVCRQIKTGPEVCSVNPPEEVREGKSSLLELEMTDGSHLLLCAENADDMRAWQYSLEASRAMPPHPGAAMGLFNPSMGPFNPSMGPFNPSPVPIGYSYQQVGIGGYPGQIISQPSAQVVQTPNGTTTIINQASPQVIYMNEDPHRYGGFGRHGRHGRYYNSGTTYVATPRYW